MYKMKEMICRFHVIVKYLGKHKSSEKFFPIMFISLWSNIIMQSISFLAYTYYFKNLIRIEFDYDVLKIGAVVIASLTALVIYRIVSGSIYAEAENWFKNKGKNEQSILIEGVGFFVFISFVLFLVWALYEM